MEMENRKRIRLWVSYDGTDYCGWQIQPGAKTIEGELDRAISKLVKEPIHVIGASRTDAGVHAWSNVAVFDTPLSRMPADKYAYALNSFLPDDIVVQASEEVAPDWHPRHCDCVKTYEYHIWSGSFSDPRSVRFATTIHDRLDLDSMKKAANNMTGTHDYTSFCAAATVVEDKVRTVYSVEVLEETVSTDRYLRRYPTQQISQNSHIIIRVKGNGFLYNMVRIMAGTLLEVGRGHIDSKQILPIIEAKDRSQAGPTAPAKGLTLCEIKYE